MQNQSNRERKEQEQLHNILITCCDRPISKQIDTARTITPPHTEEEYLSDDDGSSSSSSTSIMTKDVVPSTEIKKKQRKISRGCK